MTFRPLGEKSYKEKVEVEEMTAVGLSIAMVVGVFCYGLFMVMRASSIDNARIDDIEQEKFLREYCIKKQK